MQGRAVALLLLLSTAAAQSFVTSVPIILRHRTNVTFLQLPLASDQNIDSTVASLCAAYSLATGRWYCAITALHACLTAALQSLSQYSSRQCLADQTRRDHRCSSSAASVQCTSRYASFVQSACSPRAPTFWRERRACCCFFLR